jgi:nitrite reductase (NO-forming)
MSGYTYPDDPGERHVGLQLFAVFAGILIPIVLIIGLWMAISAHQARNDANAAAKAASVGAPTTPGHSMSPSAANTSGGTYPTPSFAGIAPANADALAMARAATPGVLPAAPAGDVATVNLGIQHGTISIAPGIRYQAWSFGGTVPGPVIHVRQGQLLRVTLVNKAPVPHSVDFHAARVAPNVAFADVAPGASKTFSFRATDSGVFMYHCGTAPAFEHIANGMYGAIVVEPRNMPHADKQYVLVSSEWYLNSAGNKAPAGLDVTKAEQMTPDWVTWNGYAAQYKTHPLTAQPGQTVRFWVVDAGPSLNTDFHVVGTLVMMWCLRYYIL